MGSVSNRLKDRGFQSNLLRFILPCGVGREEGKRGDGKSGWHRKIAKPEWYVSNFPCYYLFIVMNLLDLIQLIAYDFSVQKMRLLSIQISKGVTYNETRCPHLRSLRCRRRRRRRSRYAQDRARPSEPSVGHREYAISWMRAPHLPRRPRIGQLKPV